ncbi:MAG: radical SAM protein [Planctomycetota bacterium]|jgi:wyosine [tRNA(Phe)-imidazoG37] synthetase (radical SAM superfamily)|nr:radical SAM protein [Planctomycetota bacterium]
MPIPLQDAWLYGPVDSRRYGRSLGVNPLPVDRKLCSLDCLYCQYGFTKAQNVAGRAELPGLDELKAAFHREFSRLAEANDLPNRITVAGNGEPTLHPDFLEISRALCKSRDQHFPGATIGLLCNSMHLNREDVVEAINNYYDEPAMKLEWGTADCFAAMNRVPADRFKSLLSGLEKIRRFVVQALFMHSPHGDNATQEEVTLWIEHMTHLRDRIVRVELYSLDRPPANAAEATRLSQQELASIADRVSAAGFEVESY